MAVCSEIHTKHRTWAERGIIYNQSVRTTQ